jgi:hypothetical protein
MGIIERFDLNDVLLANFVNEIGDHFIEVIFADLHAIVNGGCTWCAGPLLHGRRLPEAEGAWLMRDSVGSSRTGTLKCRSFPGGRRSGDGMMMVRSQVLFISGWDNQRAAARRTLDLGSCGRRFYAQILFTVPALEVNIHNRCLFVRGTACTLTFKAASGEKKRFRGGYAHPDETDSCVKTQADRIPARRDCINVLSLNASIFSIAWAFPGRHLCSNTESDLNTNVVRTLTQPRKAGLRSA